MLCTCVISINQCSMVYVSISLNEQNNYLCTSIIILFPIQKRFSVPSIGYYMYLYSNFNRVLNGCIILFQVIMNCVKLTKQSENRATQPY